MDETVLQIGNQVITLTKSDALVGVSAKAGSFIGVDQLAARFGAKPTAHSLGGFHLLSASHPVDATLDAIRADPVVSRGTHVYHTSSDGVPFVPTGRLYVRFAETTSEVVAQAILDQHGLVVLQVKLDRTAVVRTTSRSLNPIKVASELQQNPAVSTAEPDLATPLAFASPPRPIDPLSIHQWHLRNTGELDGSCLGLVAGADARILDAWALMESLGSPNVIIAVLDDGFDLGHPDLFTETRIVAPWDFRRNSADPRPEFTDTNPVWNAGDNRWYGDWHGTACAGLALGRADGSGIVGAAPDCRFMPVRLGQQISVDQVVAWFDYVRVQGADVVSCSWHALAHKYPLSTEIADAITRCATEGRDGKGCVICFAAGNHGSDLDQTETYLNGFALHPEVITVAASTSRDEKAHYSNFGSAISVCAPSDGAGCRGMVTSDVLGVFERNGKRFESGYGPGGVISSFGGTSSANALVAGICALILSVKPELTAREVKRLLQATARKIPREDEYDASGYSRLYVYGCVNAAAAVHALL